MKNISVMMVVLAFIALSLIILGHAMAHVQTNDNMTYYSQSADKATTCALEGVEIEKCHNTSAKNKNDIGYLDSFEVFKQ